MAVAYNYKKGIDLPAWQWLAPCLAGNSNPGASQVYDGKRYQYWAIQVGSTGAVSTTQLWRYDMWSNAWQYLVALTNGFNGIDMEYDSVRNALFITNGNSAVTWQCFNLNLTSITVVNQVIPAFSLATITVTLPVAAGAGASLTMPSDDVVANPIDTGTADVTGNTTTQIQGTTATGTFGQGMTGLQVRVLTGTQAGVVRTILSVTAPTIVTLASAMPGPLAAGDNYVIEQQSATAASATTTTLTGPTTGVNQVSWVTNKYANQDLMIISGTGSGQRRRIASNTASVITLAAAVTGNTLTGPFTTTPDATSVYRIVPSHDFLYYQPGNGSATLYRIDVAQTTGVAWVAMTAPPAAPSGGANTFYPSSYAPYQIICVRGSGTATVYMFDTGLNAWTTPTIYAGSETFTTGASAALISGKRKIIFQKEGATRLYILDLLTGIYEPGGTMPYAAPAAYDGHRARVITTPDGAQFLYILRAGGQEFFRVPLEWL